MLPKISKTHQNRKAKIEITYFNTTETWTVYAIIYFYNSLIKEGSWHAQICWKYVCITKEVIRYHTNGSKTYANFHLYVNTSI